MKLFKIVEDIIGIASQPHAVVDIELPVDATEHSHERQSRHEFDYISEKEIIKTVEQASQKIVNDFTRAAFGLGDIFVIKDSSNYLNVVGKLTSTARGLKLKVITVMRKKDFKTSDRIYHV